MSAGERVKKTTFAERGEPTIARSPPVILSASRGTAGTAAQDQRVEQPLSRAASRRDRTAPRRSRPAEALFFFSSSSASLARSAAMLVGPPRDASHRASGSRHERSDDEPVRVRAAGRADRRSPGRRPRCSGAAPVRRSTATRRRCCARARDPTRGRARRAVRRLARARGRASASCAQPTNELVAAVS